MISLFSGTPGSGKSLHLAEIIFARTNREKITIGNFDVNRNVLNNPEFYVYCDNQDLIPDYLINFSREYFRDNKFKEGAILLIVDEAQLIFNVREWSMVGRSDWIHFFTQHRKLGYDIILVAQFDRMLDKQLRSLLEYEYIHRKMSNFGWKGKMISIWTGNRLFMCVQRWYPLNERIGAHTFLYNKRLGSLYDTLGLFEKPDVAKQEADKFVQNHDIKLLEVAGSEVVDSKNAQNEDIDIEFEDI